MQACVLETVQIAVGPNRFQSSFYTSFCICCRTPNISHYIILYMKRSFTTLYVFLVANTLVYISVISVWSQAEVPWRSDSIGSRDILIWASTCSGLNTMRLCGYIRRIIAVAIVRYVSWFPTSWTFMFGVAPRRQLSKISYRLRVADIMLYVKFHLLCSMLCCTEACK